LPWPQCTSLFGGGHWHPSQQVSTRLNNIESVLGSETVTLSDSAFMPRGLDSLSSLLLALRPMATFTGNSDGHVDSRRPFSAPLEAGVRRLRYRDAEASAEVIGEHQDSLNWDAEPPIRIGHGFDIHRMAKHGDAEVGGPVVIGGVSFDDFELGVVAHSDGDVIYHSVVDAIFGALTLPDIGQFFPDTDPRWKGAASDVFMKEAWKQMDNRGYRIGNIDVTLIAQAPRMMDKNHPLAEAGKPYDHKVTMKDNIASLLRCPIGRVNVKARTHENVDAVGEKRALSCHVVVVLEHVR